MTYAVRFDPGDAVAVVDRGIVVVLGAGAGPRLLTAVEEAFRPCGFEAVVRRLAAIDLAELPSIVVVGCQDATLRVLVRGEVSVEVDAARGEQHRFDGTSLTTWSEHVVESAIACRLTVGRPTTADPTGELPFAVSTGVVPVSRLTIAVAGWSAAPAIDPGGGADVSGDTEFASELISPPPAAPDVGRTLVEAPEPHESADAQLVGEDHLGAEVSVVSGLSEATTAWSGEDPVEPSPAGAEGSLSPGESAGGGEEPEVEDLEHTSFRSVEDAAVREALEDPFPGHPELIQSAPGREGVASPVEAQTDEHRPTDHDGLTVSLSPRRVSAAASQPPASVDRATIDPSAPVIPAARCTSGHLNPPYASSCRVCGGELTDEQFSAPRPSLGSLEFSDGQSVELARSLLIGRSPRIEGAVGADLPALVTVESPGKEVSGLHLEIRLDDWQVLVVDRNSTNGTTVRFPEREPVRLRAGEAMPIVPGTVVSLADEVEFVFVVTP